MVWEKGWGGEKKGRRVHSDYIYYPARPSWKDLLAHPTNWKVCPRPRSATAIVEPQQNFKKATAKCPSASSCLCRPPPLFFSEAAKIEPQTSPWTKLPGTSEILLQYNREGVFQLTSPSSHSTLLLLLFLCTCADADEVVEKKGLHAGITRPAPLPREGEGRGRDCYERHSVISSSPLLEQARPWRRRGAWGSGRTPVRGNQAFCCPI